MFRTSRRISLVAIFAFVILSRGNRLWSSGFLRGDIDRSGGVDITDPIKLLGSLFLGDPKLACLDAADANDSGEIDISDPIYELLYLFVGGAEPPPPFHAYGDDPTADRLDCENGDDWVHRWNRIAIDASGLDHTPARPGEQLGPGRASRAMAIVQIAVFEAVNAIAGGYQSYIGLAFPPPANTSMKAAVAQAAHDTLVALYPSQAAALDALLAGDLAKITDDVARINGIDLGKIAATGILARRADDGAQHPEPQMEIDYLPGNEPGIWRQDPVSLIPVALGARWAEVKPFAMESASQFRVPPPPAINSPEYAAAYAEVQRLGGDGLITATERTEKQTHIGIFWAYDGTPSLCAPPRLYNQIAVQIADQMGSSTAELARLLALVNMAMADAGIGVWESKYHYNYWRPVAGIRESDPGTGPTGDGDGNAATGGDPTFTPLGAPASNLAGVDFTPPFPAYPSGHAGFGGALFQTLRNFYGTDAIPFTFISDEFNGVTRDRHGNERPFLPRSFGNLSAAEEENGQSRIYLGIHWSFDKTEGIAQGRSIANHVFGKAFKPTTP